jgi:hypothetical protein
MAVVFTEESPKKSGGCNPPTPAEAIPAGNHPSVGVAFHALRDRR